MDFVQELVSNLGQMASQSVTKKLLCMECKKELPRADYHGSQNLTCGLDFDNDRRDTECLNCSVGQVCFGGSGFAPDGSTDNKENKPLTCPANSIISLL